MLTRRQQEVCSLVAQGFNNAQIKDRLCISKGTLSKHIDAIHKAYGVHGRFSLTLRLLKDGGIAPLAASDDSVTLEAPHTLTHDARRVNHMQLREQMIVHVNGLEGIDYEVFAFGTDDDGTLVVELIEAGWDGDGAIVPSVLVRNLDSLTIRPAA